MAYSLFISPIWAFSDDNGDPASGWKLYTYEVGTTAPKIAYQDVDGLAQHTNPIVLNARGEPGSEIYLDGAYKFVLTDEAGVTKWTADNASGLVTTDQLDDLSGVTDASAARTNLGLGTAAVKNTGTSGDAVPLLNAANTWSGVQTFSATAAFSAGFGAIGFEAYATVAQTITAGAFRKIECPTELFDSHGWYDATTNYRFTPQLAGKYLVVGAVGFQKGAAGERSVLTVYKNGSAAKRLGGDTSVGTDFMDLCGSCIVSMNGTTDYIELHAFVSADDDTVPAGGAQVYFGATYIGT